MDILAEDIKYLKNAKVVMFEYFAIRGKAQRNYDALMKSVGLKSEVTISTTPRKERYVPCQTLQICKSLLIGWQRTRLALDRVQ